MCGTSALYMVRFHSLQPGYALAKCAKITQDNNRVHSWFMYQAFDYLQAEFLFWSVAIVVMAADDAAMLAMMFC
jgi:hypothetical protein